MARLSFTFSLILVLLVVIPAAVNAAPQPDADFLEIREPIVSDQIYG